MPRFAVSQKDAPAVQEVMTYLHASQITPQTLGAKPKELHVSHRVWDAVATWINIARADSPNFGNGEHKLPGNIDWCKSSLLGRLLYGLKPYSRPVPCAYGYPWYDVLDETEVVLPQDEIIISEDYVCLGQSIYPLIERRDNGYLIADMYGRSYALAAITDQHPLFATKQWVSMGGCVSSGEASWVMALDDENYHLDIYMAYRAFIKAAGKDSGTLRHDAEGWYIQGYAQEATEEQRILQVAKTCKLPVKIHRFDLNK